MYYEQNFMVKFSGIISHILTEEKIINFENKTNSKFKISVFMTNYFFNILSVKKKC